MTGLHANAYRVGARAHMSVSMCGKRTHVRAHACTCARTLVYGHVPAGLLGACALVFVCAVRYACACVHNANLPRRALGACQRFSLHEQLILERS